jgi:uncharacterized membrane protein YhaH (DUF805 family)
MEWLAAAQWEIIDRLYNLLTQYPQTLLVIPVVWIVMILVFQRLLHVHVSPWIALLTLIVSVGIVIGILLLYLQGNPSAYFSLLGAI